MAKQLRRPLRRGHVVTIAGRGDAVGRPRPGVVVQADLYDEMDSVMVCMTTKYVGYGFPMRIFLEPSVSGLDLPSDIQVDKVTWVFRKRIDQLIARLPDDIMERVDQALLALLDLERYMSKL